MVTTLPSIQTRDCLFQFQVTAEIARISAIPLEDLLQRDAENVLNPAI
jgi:hypothetical protein